MMLSEMLVVVAVESAAVFRSMVFYSLLRSMIMALVREVVRSQHWMLALFTFRRWHINHHTLSPPGKTGSPQILVAGHPVYTIRLPQYTSPRSITTLKSSRYIAFGSPTVRMAASGILEITADTGTTPSD